MKKLCVLFVLLSSMVGAIAQTNNRIVSMVEEAVIECYDTLLTHQDYRLQKFTRGELYDTNIYLYLNCIDEKLFVENLQNPNQIPSHIFFHKKGGYQFVRRASLSSTGEWTYCRCPNNRKSRAIEVMMISSVDFVEDTLCIHLTHCYYSKEKEWRNGRCIPVGNWEISGGATWKYIFSEERREWVCIQKRFREI
ncbi:MAG: hypothetical protein IKO89_09870 [Bacteroidales bacterium]|nr:hypothetical protein [Bacteroidales bacterium]MBR4488851.1 hypothetical protein [Bacteroidales bacterium]